MADTLHFGPEWLRNLSGGGSVTSPPPSPAAPAPCLKLAQHQYGREAMLALYRPGSPPARLKHLRAGTVYEHAKDPLCLQPISEQEQMLLSKPINSHVVLKTLRDPRVVPGGPGLRGRGSVDRGRARGRGGRTDYRGPYEEAPDGYNSRYYRSDSYDENGSLVSPRRIDFSRSMSNDNWRDRRRDEEEDPRRVQSRGSARGYDNRGQDRDRYGTGEEEGEGEWRVQRGGSTRGRQPPEDEELPQQRAREYEGRANQSRNWRSDRGRGGGTSGPQRGSYRGSSSYETRPATRRGQNTRDCYDEDEPPEWSLPDDSGEPGSFDASGAFVSSKQPSVKEKSGPTATSNKDKPKPDSPQQQQAEPAVESEADAASADTGQGPVKLNDLSAPSSAAISGAPAYFTRLHSAAEQFVCSMEDAPSPPPSQGHPPASQATALSTSHVLSQGVQALHSQSQASQQPLVAAKSKEWFYKDPQGAEQGPFSAAEMYDWFKAGYFDMSLLIRSGNELDFRTLGQITKDLGSVPFVEEPRTNPAQRDSPAASPQQVDSPTVPQSSTPAGVASLPGLGASGSREGAASGEALQAALLQQQILQQQMLQHQLLMQHALQHVVSREDLQHLSPAQQHQVAMEIVLRQMSTVQTGSSALSVAPDVRASLPVSQPVPSWPSAVDATQSTLGSSGGAGSGWPPSATAENVLTSSAAAVGSAAVTNAWHARAADAAQKAAEERKEEEAEMRRKEEELLRRQREEEEREKQRLEAERLALEALRKKEEERLEEERLRQQRLEEEEKRRREEEARLAAEKARKKEEERRERLRQEQERQAAEQRRLEEEKRRLEAERLAKEEEEALAAAARRHEEMKRAILEEDKRKRAEAQKAEEARRKRQQEAIARQQQSKQQMANIQLPSSAQWPVAGDLEAADTRSLAEIQAAEAAEHRANQLREQQAAALSRHEEEERGPRSWGASPPSAVSGLSLKQIQQEQEKQRRREDDKRSDTVASLPLGTAAIWSGAAPTVIASTQPAGWGSAKPQSKPAAPQAGQGFWDDPPLISSNKKNKQDESAFPALGGKSSPIKKQKPQSHQTQPVVKTKEQARVQSLFQQKKIPEDELEAWCLQKISKLNNSMDAATFYEILKAVDSPYEVHDYVRQFLGEARAAQEFAKEFLERRSQQRSAVRAAKQRDEDNLWGPAPAVKPVGASPLRPAAISSKPQATTREQAPPAAATGKKKKKGGRMQKVDSGILGFMVHADSSRTNVGEIDHA